MGSIFGDFGANDANSFDEEGSAERKEDVALGIGREASNVGRERCTIGVTNPFLKGCTQRELWYFLPIYNNSSAIVSWQMSRAASVITLPMLLPVDAEIFLLGKAHLKS